MASLTGQTIQSTYDALLKISGNDALTSSLQRITDGLGNFSPLYLSTTAVEISSGLNVVGSITGSNLSGTNTGDETNSTIKSKLGAATSSNDGYLTATDWSTFNAKQNALGYTPVPNTRSLTINGTAYDLSADRSWSVGTVTSVGLSVPTGFAVSNSPVTGSGTLGLSFAAGYSLPTNLSQASWDTAFSSRIATFTTTGNSGAATFASNTLNIPNYTLSGLGGVPTTRTLTINGTSYDLSADRSWTISTGLSGSGTTNYIPKFTGSTSLGNSLIFDNGTNVGIGTSSPSSFSILDANGQVRVSNNSVIGFYQARTSDSAGSGVFGGNSFSLRNGATSEDLAFDIFNRNTSAWYTPMIIKNATGNVGIAKTSPTNPLHIGTGANSILLDGVKVDRDPSTTSSAIFNAFGGGANIISNGGATSSFPPIIFSSSDGTTTNERVRITGTGNVGIGTTSPSVKLHVIGDTRVEGSYIQLVNSSNPSYYINNTSVQWRYYLNSSNHIAFSDAVRDVLTLGYNGSPSYFQGCNVGIGTTSPDQRLHVVAPAGYISKFSNNSSNNERLEFYIDGGEVSLVSGYNTTARPLKIYTGGAERMIVTATGNVGIGTTSPASLLTIKGSSNYNGVLSIDSTGAIGGGALALYQNGVQSGFLTVTGVALGTSGRDLAYYANAGLGHVFYTNDGSERMRITSGGNVGIGTTSPSYPLQVRRAGGAGSLGISIDSVGSTDRAVQYFAIQDSASGAGSGHAFYYRQPSSTTDTLGLFLNEDGNVGIGTSSPGERFEVNGSIKATGRTTLGTSVAGLTISYESGVGYIESWQSSPILTRAYNYIAWDTFGSERMRITSGGNVGIGTTSPQGILEAVGLSYFTRAGQSLLINPNYAGSNQHIQLQATGSMALSFATGGDNERMRITSGGNVGVNTSNPIERLDVRGKIYVNNGGELYIDPNSTNTILATTGARPFIFEVNSAERMRITSSGNVGLNTSSPSYRLDVNGDIRSTGVIRVNTGTIDTVMTFDTGAGAIGTLTNHNLNFWINGTAQAKITTGNQFYVGTGVVDGSAKVQIDSTTQGFLPPRMTSLQRIAITTPAVGLIVYQTDNAGGLGGNEGLYVYKSGGWTFII